MRIFLALIFFAPVIGYLAARISPDLLLPSLIAASVVALAAQFIVERRQRTPV
ncbi:MAG: hypothetical protein LJE62_14445 [Silicimonas sp.]|jgi:hypothetical protein|nr:hypothetical protein [Silicimonas sp.]